MPSLKSSPLKNRPKPKFKGMVFQPAFFRGKLAVNFRECIAIFNDFTANFWVERPWEWSMKEQQTKHFEETKLVVLGSKVLWLKIQEARPLWWLFSLKLSSTFASENATFSFFPCSSGRLSARWYSHEHGRQLHQPSWDRWTWPSCSRRLWEYQADNTLGSPPFISHEWPFGRGTTPDRGLVNHGP